MSQCKHNAKKNKVQYVCKREYKKAMGNFLLIRKLKVGFHLGRGCLGVTTTKSYSNSG